MNRKIPTALALIGLSLLHSICAQATPLLVEPAGTIVENNWPTNTGEIRWQQVYDDSFFGSDPITINSFAFRGNAIGIGSVSYGSDFTVSMSTTSAEPGSLSTTFASNIGADEAVVLSGPISISSTIGVFTTFVLDSPFEFNPSMGNLLIEITHAAASASDSTIWWDAYDPTVSSLERVATNAGAGAATGTSFERGELVTQFDVTSDSSQVPAPTTLVLMGLGLAGIGYRKMCHLMSGANMLRLRQP